MKYLALLGSIVLLAACCTNPDSRTYRQVMVTPSCKQVSCWTQRVKQSLCCQKVTIINQEPIDVTTTVIDYY